MVTGARGTMVSSCSWQITIPSDFCVRLLFFFNATATTEIYTLSLHDALPIYTADLGEELVVEPAHQPAHLDAVGGIDRKSTRLNSSHQIISYAVFCLNKK